MSTPVYSRYLATDAVAPRLERYEPARADTIQFGTHGTLDGYGGSLKALRNLDAVRTLLERLPRELAMKIIAEPSVVQVGAQNEKDSGGVSGFVMIAESHISAHTFPSRRFISADVYTCQNSLDFDSIVKSFTDVFELQDIEVHIIRRGTRFPAKDLVEAW